jgi:hypothetical protein
MRCNFVTLFCCSCSIWMLYDLFMRPFSHIYVYYALCTQPKLLHSFFSNPVAVPHACCPPPTPTWPLSCHTCSTLLHADHCSIAPCVTLLHVDYCPVACRPLFCCTLLYLNHYLIAPCTTTTVLLHANHCPVAHRPLSRCTLLHTNHCPVAPCCTPTTVLLHAVACQPLSCCTLCNLVAFGHFTLSLEALCSHGSFELLYTYSSLQPCSTSLTTLFVTIICANRFHATHGNLDNSVHFHHNALCLVADVYQNHHLTYTINSPHWLITPTIILIDHQMHCSVTFTFNWAGSDVQFLHSSNIMFVHVASPHNTLCSYHFGTIEFQLIVNAITLSVNESIAFGVRFW